jgi:hypothetical protein
MISAAAGAKSCNLDERRIATMLNGLSKTLSAVGKRFEWFAVPDGTRLLLLPYGARVLGLAAAENEENFFWSNPRLRAADTAQALFAQDGWHNTGGDRTWIAPELDTFFPEANSTRYWQPRALDMSDYEVERTGGGVQLSRRMTLRLSRTENSVDLRLTKWFGPAANPLRYERDLAGLAPVEYAGYTQRVAMESTDESSETPSAVGIWNLVQLPPGGEMLVPLYSRATPQKCFGDMPADHIAIDDHLLRIDADFSGSHKIAVKAASICGRLGYVRHHGDRWTLVVRNCFPNPSGEYVDVQRHDPNDFGYAFQMCRVDEVDFGSFCEMEYHAPALGGLPYPRRSEDISQLWAFRGGRKAIDAIARKLLGARL